MDPLRDAFQKIKQDIELLRESLNILTSSLIEMNSKINSLNQEIIQLKQPPQLLPLTPSTSSLNISFKPKTPSTDQQIIPTSSTHPSTDQQVFKPLNAQNLPFSTGNGGVPTDRQTHQQTDRHTENVHQKAQNPIENAAEILDSLDSLKREIRLKFKRLTEREWIVFSTIYQLEEEGEFADYKVIAQRLNLTESSIRDYVGRLLQKGIPLTKVKINNKQIQLSISKNLKKIASLSTILQLRNL
jgi:chromosome segregation ATPase